MRGLGGTHFTVCLPDGRYSTMGQNQGGVVLLRPCKPVAAHMQKLVASNHLLQFEHGHAEQDFLDWRALPCPDQVLRYLPKPMDMPSKPSSTRAHSHAQIRVHGLCPNPFTFTTIALQLESMCEYSAAALLVQRDSEML